MPAVTGILETCLHVADLPQSIEFYRRLFGWPVLFSDARMAALAVASQQLLLLFVKDNSEEDMPIAGGIIPGHGGAGRLHVAFAIAKWELESWTRRLRECDVELTSTVHWPTGGVSLYFRDPDQHLIELATPGIWPIY
jgi:catechol 2,3-dioxygenase-like lactoylglutathione lyase family enzyme